MGLTLSDSKKGRKTKEVKPTPKSAKNGKAAKKSKPKKVSTRPAVDQDDEVVLPSKVVQEAKPTEVKIVGAFEGGLVHTSLRNGVNAHRYRSEESDLFGQVLSNVCLVDGVFFGAIYVKSSFAKRTGGSALL